MAQTVNGMIARENGSEDFLSDQNWKTFQELAEKAGGYIIGRKTYQAVMSWTDYNFNDIDAKGIIVSTNRHFKPKSKFLIANSPHQAIEKASSLGFKQVILTGGSTLNSSFLKQKLIDLIILNIEPFILAKGITLFAEENIQAKLKLVKVEKITKNILQLEYKVIKSK